MGDAALTEGAAPAGGAALTGGAAPAEEVAVHRNLARRDVIKAPRVARAGERDAADRGRPKLRAQRLARDWAAIKSKAGKRSVNS